MAKHTTLPAACTPLSVLWFMPQKASTEDKYAQPKSRAKDLEARCHSMDFGFVACSRVIISAFAMALNSAPSMDGCVASAPVATTREKYRGAVNRCAAYGLEIGDRNIHCQNTSHTRPSNAFLASVSFATAG